MVSHEAFTLQDKVHARAPKPWTLFQQILHSVENLMVIRWFFLIADSGPIGSDYRAGPTLAQAEGFLYQLYGIALFIGP